ncbi:MAG: Rrf2 family transcriptional regulator [Verrucomicrobia bacterium]|nr:Rrf2 family transcriptional regulator [Verrucomicrobiota bacterium]
MKISQKLEYACRALSQLAKHHDGRTLTRLDDLAQREDISRSYLLQILNDLRRAGLIDSCRGAAGGYLLARPAGTISLRQVVESVDPALLQNSVTLDGESGPAIQSVWEKISIDLRDALNRITLESISAGPSSPMFFI